jgi:hypothetical protein
MTRLAIIFTACAIACSVSFVPQKAAAVEVVLVTNGVADGDTGFGGPSFDILTGGDDTGAYFSASDWIDVDFLVDDVISFGMTFGNSGGGEKGPDPQVKLLQEYDLAPVYAENITADTLESATLVINIDRVIDMTLGGATDLVGPATMYINVFEGDGILNEFPGLQDDFDRCDRLDPFTWDTSAPLENEDGIRITEDLLFRTPDGRIPIQFDVTERVRDLLTGESVYAGICAAGSNDGDLTLMSIDGGGGGNETMPRLIIVGEPALVGGNGDCDDDGDVDLPDFGQFQICFSGSDAPAPAGCECADLDGDSDVDLVDFASFQVAFTGPGGASASVPVAATTPREIGDFNNDGLVDRTDAALLQACMESSAAESCTAMDINQDGLIDAVDAGAFGMKEQP